MPRDGSRAQPSSPGLLLAWLLLDAVHGRLPRVNGPSTVSRILLAAGLLFLLYVTVAPPVSGPAADRRDGRGRVRGAPRAGARGARPLPVPPGAARAADIAMQALALLCAVWPPAGSEVCGRRLRGVSPTRSNRRPSWSIGFVVVTAIAARVPIIANDVEPGFDVHLIQEAAGQAPCSRLQNPYSVPTVYYSGYPYWPLSALMAAGGLLFGDARWGLPVADAVTVVAFVVIARNVGAPARLGALAAALLLWNSSGLYITWQSLPEPMVIALAAVGIAILTWPTTRKTVAGSRRASRSA